MAVEFQKYQGTGNDFIIINDTDNAFKNSPYNSQAGIKLLCDRNFGIGSDGLMLFQKSDIADFKMKYYNSDGNEGSMCGNGGRCIAAFAYNNGYTEESMHFEAIDGKHSADILKDENDNENSHNVILKMQDISDFKEHKNGYYINSGSPHYVIFLSENERVDVAETGRKIRHSEDFMPGGTNVNFVQSTNGLLHVRTYERGVERETLSCGTGVVASAIAAYLSGKTIKKPQIKTPGGNLYVNFFHNKEKKIFTDVALKGPANFVFKGVI